MDPFALGQAYQAARSARSRRAFGEHYTPEPVVLRTLNPLFLDALRTSGDLSVLAATRVFDPACGTGNFLVVAYRELRRLEASLGASSLVKLENFYGIEVDAGAAEVAVSALRVAASECDREFGPSVPGSPRIVVGNALTMDWATVCPPSPSVVVAGNPPFVGPKERSAFQTADLRAVWGPRNSGMLDYVSGWFLKASSYCQADWAFVATNSVVQGQGVPTLFGAVFAAGWRIRFAFRTFTWPGAAVHCVIVGFSRSGASALLDGSAVPHINAYLISGPDVLVTPRRTPLSPDLPPIVAGSKAVDWGHLTVSPSDYASVAADPIASRYLRPYYGGEELINALDRWCLWFEDAPLSYLYQSPLLAARLDAVRALRLASPKAATRAAAETPHLFHERRQPKVPYLGIPQTFTENRPYATAGYLQPDVIASIKLFTAPDPDGFLFGLVSSSVFLTWQRTVGGRMKSDPSFTNTVVWNTLPLPTLGATARQRVAAAGQAVLIARDPTVSLAAQYGALSPQLTEAHRRLDEVVDRLFRVDGHSRQQALFTRYIEPTRPRRVT